MNRHLNGRSAAAALAGISALAVVALLAAPGADAGSANSAKAPPSAQTKAVAAARVLHQLGSHGAGAFYAPAAGRMVVNVTQRADFAAVRAAGAKPRLVAYSGRQLAAVQRDLKADATIAGTTWGVDVRTDKVRVTADSSVSRSDLSRLRAVIARYPGRAVLARTSGTLKPLINGGKAIYVTSYRCSLGFNVTNGTTAYFLTAGHCTNLGSSWYQDAGHTQFIGTTVGSSFPGDDYGVVQFAAGVKHPGTVFLYGGKRNITDATSAYVGEAVQRSGSTTGVHGGNVQALNITVNYSEGTVFGLIQTNVCAEGGDSGGPLFDGKHGVGLTSGGSGNCSSGGTTFFQPVTEPLGVYGLTVL